MNSNSNKGWHIKQSFTDDFVDVMRDISIKYGDKIFAIQGIANEHLDLVQFSKNFFKSASNTADVSVDGNANVREKNIMQYNYEANKSLMKLNSLYLLYKWVKKYFKGDVAAKCLEKVVSGELFVNDLVNFSMPYSYYQQTPLIIRVNEGAPRLITMKKLFEEYEEFVEIKSDRETIDMLSVWKPIDYHGFSIGSEKKKTVLSGKSCQILIQKHVIDIMDADGKWVRLERVLRHKNDKGFVIYQTKNGDMAFVTSDHPVIMQDGSEKKASDLCECDFIKGSDFIPEIRSIVDVPIDMAYLMGFLAGDGSVGRHKFYYGSNNITNEDVSIKIDELRGNIHIYQKNIVESKIYCVVKELFPNCEIRIRDDRQIVFNSNNFRMLLAKFFGLNSDNSYNKYLPINILDWTEESISAYIAGLIDSDGTINSNGSINLRMSAYSIINQLSDVFNAMCIHNAKSIKQIGESSSGYNKGKMTFLFGINFQPNDVMIANSSKLVGYDCIFNNNMDTCERSNEICKIYTVNSSMKKVLQSGDDILEYVYDVTTSSGTFYSCGMVQHNCFAFDLRNLMSNGMNFFKGNMPIYPPKRSDSFYALLIQTTAYISNQILGAASYPDFFVVLDYFYRKEMGEDYIEKLKNKDNKEWNKVKNQFQNLIFSFNFPFRGNQSLSAYEKIIVNGKTIEIGEFVENNLKENEDFASVNDMWTYSLNKRNGKLEKKKVKGVIRHKLLDNFLVEYKTVLGQKFVGTRGHSLFTRDGLDIKEINADEEVDNIIVPFNFCKNTKVSVLDVPNVGGRLSVNKLELTPEIMYMFGQYIGDGIINGSRMNISTFNDKVNEKIKNCVCNYFSTKVSSRNDIGVNIGKNVAKLIIDIFGKGSHNKDIPRDWYDEENILYLIGGYIDADGHARQDKGDLIITSVNRNLLESVQFILLSRGIVSKIKESEREGFGKKSIIYRLVIPVSYAVKLNNYLVIKKVLEKNRLDYSRQVFDFDGIYQYIMNKYHIRGLAENGVISARSRDKSISYNDIVKIVEWLRWVIDQESSIKDDFEFMNISLSPKYRNGDYSNQVVIEKSKRIFELQECLNKLSIFLDAVPIRLESLIEVDSEKYVYDISVEDNENFVTANNLYAHNSCFTNLSVMDSGFMKQLFSGYQFPDFSLPNIDSSVELSKIFFEYYSEINGSEGIFTFPVMTIAISLDDNGEYIDPDFVDWAAIANCGKATANIFQSKPTAFSSCCRLRSDYDKLSENGYQNSFGVGGLSVGCYDDKTEVLTNEGWKYFNNLNKEELICTLNLNSGEIEYQEPTDYINSYYNGKMHHYNNQSIDLLVTPNHNMVAKSRKTGEIKLIQSSDLKSGYNLPRIGGMLIRQDFEKINIDGIYWNANDFYYLLGFYLGSESIYHQIDDKKYMAYEISFQLFNEHEICAIEGVLDSIGIKYNKCYIKTRNCWNIRFYSKDFWKIVQSLGKCGEKHVSRDLLDVAGPCNLQKLLDGLLDTNGSHGTCFSSSSKQLADDVVEICCLIGIPTTLISSVHDDLWFKRKQRFIQGDIYYEVKLLLKDREINNYSKYKDIIQYDGNIYCVTVPNHIIMVRRNGKVAWSGNSHRVAGLNLPRIALLEKDNPDILEEDLDLLHKILISHRRLIQHRIDGGSMPLYDTGWIHLKRQYSTIGFVGGYEYVVNKGLDIKTQDGVDALKCVLKKIESKIVEWQLAEKDNVIRIDLGGDNSIILSDKDKLTVQEIETGNIIEIKAIEYFNNKDKYLVGI